MKITFIACLWGCLILSAVACSHADNDDGCNLGCDGNFYSSVLVVKVIDDSTDEEICCPTDLYLNEGRLLEAHGNADCVCTWYHDGEDNFIDLDEPYINYKLGINLIRVEVGGYQSWEEEIDIPCECHPRRSFTARVTPEP